MATTIQTPGLNPPAYQTHELTTLRPSTSTSSSSYLPSYDDVRTPSTVSGPSTSAPPSYPASTSFNPTQKLRIDAKGLRAFRLPGPPRTDPIPIYDVTVGRAAKPLYVSRRDNRCSGTCRIVKGSTFSGLVGGYGGEEEEEEEVLCTTTYRFGPGRPPVITLNGSGGGYMDDEEGSAEEIAIEGAGTFTRTQTLRTPHGTFRWRYASSKERGALSQPQSQSQTEAHTQQDSVLILEKLTTVSPSYPSRSPFNRQKSEQIPTEVARFVRGPGTRTEGSSRSDAGNGGLLLLNLSDWSGEKRGEEEEEVRVLVVASCIAMLKKEVDRRRGVQAAVMVSVIS